MKSSIIIVVSCITIIGGLWFFFDQRGGIAQDVSEVKEKQEEIAVVAEKEKIPQEPEKTNMEVAQGQNPVVVLTTNMGDITIEMFMDTMPLTAGNFLKLARQDFYDDVKFHRVISGFMIQGGDPNSKGENTATYGTGGPGYTIKDEFAAENANARGTISMANAGPNTGGSQFFINLVSNDSLNQKHPVFGKVIAGMDVVDKIAAVKTNERDLPVTPVIIKDVTIKQ